MGTFFVNYEFLNVGILSYVPWYDQNKNCALVCRFWYKSCMQTLQRYPQVSFWGKILYEETILETNFHIVHWNSPEKVYFVNPNQKRLYRYQHFTQVEKREFSEIVLTNFPRWISVKNDQDIYISYRDINFVENRSWDFYEPSLRRYVPQGYDILHQGEKLFVRKEGSVHLCTKEWHEEKNYDVKKCSINTFFHAYQEKWIMIDLKRARVLYVDTNQSSEKALTLIYSFKKHSQWSLLPWTHQLFPKFTVGFYKNWIIVAHTFKVDHSILFICDFYGKLIWQHILNHPSETIQSVALCECFIIIQFERYSKLYHI